MRQKQPRLVVTFSTTTAALQWERRCKELGVPGRLIPVPVTITADCGLAWSMPPEEAPRLEELAGLDRAGCCELML